MFIPLTQIFKKKGKLIMSTIKSGDRCADCSHCKVWTSDHKKASCTLYTSDQGFHPDRPVPSKCVNKVTRKF